MKIAKSVVLWLVVYVLASLIINQIIAVLIASAVVIEYNYRFRNALVKNDDSVNDLLNRLYKQPAADELIDHIISIRANKFRYTEISYRTWKLYLSSIVELYEQGKTSEMDDLVNTFLAKSMDILDLKSENSLKYRINSLKKDLVNFNRKDV